MRWREEERRSGFSIPDLVLPGCGIFAADHTSFIISLPDV